VIEKIFAFEMLVSKREQQVFVHPGKNKFGFVKTFSDQCGKLVFCLLTVLL